MSLSEVVRRRGGRGLLMRYNIRCRSRGKKKGKRGKKAFGKRGGKSVHRIKKCIIKLSEGGEGKRKRIQRAGKREGEEGVLLLSLISLSREGERGGGGEGGRILVYIYKA